MNTSYINQLSFDIKMNFTFDQNNQWWLNPNYKRFIEMESGHEWNNTQISIIYCKILLKEKNLNSEYESLDFEESEIPWWYNLNKKDADNNNPIFPKIISKNYQSQIINLTKENIESIINGDPIEEIIKLNNLDPDTVYMYKFHIRHLGKVSFNNKIVMNYVSKNSNVFDFSKEGFNEIKIFKTRKLNQIDCNKYFYEGLNTYDHTRMTADGRTIPIEKNLFE